MTNAEIQVGEYVRTEDGKIYKTDGEKLCMNNAKTILFKEIRKIPYDSIPYKVKTHSFNIIDLIEAGDYVTLGKNCGFLGITNKYEFAGELNVETSNGMLWEDAKNDKDFNLYSIITKEQLDNMEYKVGGDND